MLLRPKWQHTSPGGRDALERHGYADVTIHLVAETETYSTNFDIVVAIGARTSHGWLKYPGMPVCLHWSDNIPLPTPEEDDEAS